MCDKWQSVPFGDRPFETEHGCEQVPGMFWLSIKPVDFRVPVNKAGDRMTATAGGSSLW